MSNSIKIEHIPSGYIVIDEFVEATAFCDELKKVFTDKKEAREWILKRLGLKEVV